ncbi:MAG TPA: acyltransferase [Bradyrhizobium sp.]|nr:acyltransferase [Bradyrhizobium sp.]
MARQELLTVQYLRAIASLFILSYHLTLRYGGTIAVGAFRTDLFFVISGFIMWVITADRTIDPATFMLRRIIRLVPNYWLATMATALLILTKPNFTFGHELDPSRFVGSLFFFPTLSHDRILPVVLQGWTLVYEMMFYILISASLYITQRHRPLFIAAVISALVVAHAVLPEAHFLSVTNPNILLEFLVGVLLGVVWRNSKLGPGWALVCVVVGAIGFALSEYYRPELPPIVKFGIPSALMVAGAVFYEKVRRMPEIPFLRFLGDASYSIFVWHVFVSIIMEGLLLHLHLPIALQFVLEISSTVILSCLIYLSVERPITDHLRALLARRLMQPA